MPGRVQHVDAQPAALDDVAVGERRVDPADRVSLECVREHRNLVAAAVLVEVRDVVAVVVRQQHMGGPQPVALDRLVDRLEGPTT